MRFALSALFTLIVATSVSFSQSAPPYERTSFINDLLKDVSASKIEEYDRKLVSFGTRNTNSSQDDPNRGIGAARDWIYSEFKRISEACGGCLDVRLQTYLQEPRNRVPKAVNITNVIAELKGTSDPSRVYVVSGHYDSMCSDSADGECDAPGANDDASGTSAVIEMARVMSKKRYDATIIFMAVAGEEQGLLGATHFAEEAKKAAMNIEAMITNDIIGGVKTFKDRPDRNTVRVFAEGVPSNETEREAGLRRSVGGENDSAARQLGRYIKETADLYSPDFKVNLIYRRDRYLRGGDHIPFLERGYPAVRFTEPHEDYTHQHQNVRTEDGVFYGDTPEFIDFGYIANVTRVNIAALASMALAPPIPKDAGIVLARLTNDTDLKWAASPAEDIAGYEIVWRETTAPFWTNSKFVGDVTSFTMDEMSKDNWFFGVRAVDKDGYRSPVAYPRPTR
ncbi:MAG: M20/M25/M40 family metallo-hydrolase [Acidobacteria bacterium]|nr:MAG: M20/M25/M40 family metallo-hydrolase [Acidobacteriota bacterium]REK02825.1 MAG: M20/M25/M40 family metallo-hydrolase [Acidobacteriota bacterium]REK13371.1 MAG: M20/M25/M40 family metallo-hydrolase [Acidobacteriota bacterium]REK41365.1 MAG: M20/M25/M40 family metallo-hydrolase [Acidobacteriota bacterium]